MAEIAISGAIVALKKSATWLSDQAVDASSRLFKLKQDILWLEKEMEYIQAYLKNFDDGNTDETSNTVEAALVKNVRLLAYDVEDVLESYLTKIAFTEREGCLAWIKNIIKMLGCLGLSNPKLSLDLSIEIEEIKKRVEDINRVRQIYGITRKPSIGRGVYERRSFPHTDDGTIVGMDDKVEELKAELLANDSSHLVLSISGDAGLGKTTLAKKVYNSVVQNFSCSAWICVSQKPNIPELLRDISRQVGLDEEKWKNNTESNLYEHLRGKRYIIVIDDIWQKGAWDGLKNAIPTDSENGSRIILTSRYTYVCKYAGGEGSVHELKPLNPDESKELFFKIIFKEKKESLSPPLLETVDKILHKCGGIPLAIVLTSGMLSLRERADYAWKGVLESIGGDEDECSQIFELSYKDLPSKMRPCFLYFGFFPEDYKIRASNLINLWAAERFIQGSEIREVEEVGEDYLNQLVARNLVQVSERKSDGRIKTCHVHDILQSLCVRVAKEINFFRNINDVNNNSLLVTRVRRLANHESSLRDYISRGHHDTPKLRSMLWMKTEYEVCSKNDSKDLINNMKCLRVLCLKGGLCLHSLSRNVGNLIHLTYIQLRLLDGETIPSAIGNLRGLMTLDIRECYNTVVPGVIWEMKCLRHLMLGYQCQVKYPPYKTICNIPYKLRHNFDIYVPNLRTLDMYLPYKLTGPNKYELPNLKKLGVSFDRTNVTNIKRLLEGAQKIEILELKNKGDQIWEANNMFHLGELNLHRYENIGKITIYARIGDLTEHVFPPNITKLVFHRTELKEDPMKVLKKLPMLKFLEFRYKAYWGEKMIVRYTGDEGGSNHDNFQHLEVLVMDDIGYDFNELVIEEATMPQLKQLRLVFNFRRKITIDAPQRIKGIVTRYHPLL